jgi:hypothetical protein
MHPDLLFWAADQRRMLTMQTVVRKPGAFMHVFLLCLLSGCMVLLASASVAAAPVLPLPMKEVAPGVHVFNGVTAEQDEHNLGAISNLGFIVGTRCVAVIDTGGSPAVGAALRASVRARTDLPVCYVINTHVHPDHVLGNQAFLADGPVFVGHARLAAALAARGRHYIAAAERLMGAAGRGIELVAPSLAVSAEHTLDLGGRSLRAAGLAHRTYGQRPHGAGRVDAHPVCRRPAVRRTHARHRRQARWVAQGERDAGRDGCGSRGIGSWRRRTGMARSIFEAGELPAGLVRSNTWRFVRGLH